MHQPSEGPDPRSTEPVDWPMLTGFQSQQKSPDAVVVVVVVVVGGGGGGGGCRRCFV